MSRKSIDSKRSRSTLGRASREAESPSGGHGQRTESDGYLLSINQKPPLQGAMN